MFSRSIPAPGIRTRRTMPLAPQPVIIHRGPRRNLEAEGFAAARGLAIIAYVDDTGAKQQLANGGAAIVTFAAWREQLRDVPSIVTALDPAVRRSIAERIVAAGGTFFTMDASFGQAVPGTVTFGEGTLVADGPVCIASLTSIGSHVLVMPPASIAHNVVIGDFVTIHPSTAISGHVILEDDVILGVGTVIVNGRSGKPLRVGRGARIDAGTVVTKSVSPGEIIAGVPGRPLRPFVDTHN